MSKDEIKTTPLHFVFPLYIDPVVDIIHPKFYEVFKFNPVDEPLLEKVFMDKANRITEKTFGKNLWLPKPHVLLATKLNSVISRDKEHKRLKDIADIFALLPMPKYQKSSQASLSSMIEEISKGSLALFQNQR